MLSNPIRAQNGTEDIEKVQLGMEARSDKDMRSDRDVILDRNLRFDR